MPRPVRHILTAALLFSICAPAAAQTIDENGVTVYRNQRASGPRVTLDKKDDELYKGMIPGKRDDVEHITRKAAKTAAPNKLTWIGFLLHLDSLLSLFFLSEELPDERTRVTKMNCSDCSKSYWKSPMMK